MRDDDRGVGRQWITTVAANVHWLGPVSGALLGIAAFLVAGMFHGTRGALAVALVVECVVFAALFIGTGPAVSILPLSPRLRQRQRVTAISLVCAVLAATGIPYVLAGPNGNNSVAGSDGLSDAVLGYFSGEVNVGYMKVNYDGFHSAAHEGFDADIAYWLKEYFDARQRDPARRMTVNWVGLDTQDERISRIQDGRVKFTVSNLSITNDRDRRIDFAGPYLVDKRGYLTTKLDATTRVDGGAARLAKVCIARGTTAESPTGTDQDGIAVMSGGSVRDCLNQLRDAPPGERLAVSTDMAALETFSTTDTRDILADTPNKTMLALSGLEEYGVGLPDGRPDLCAAVTDALREYLTEVRTESGKTRWEASFERHLASRNVRLEIVERHNTDSGAPNTVTRKPRYLKGCPQPLER